MNDSNQIMLNKKKTKNSWNIYCPKGVNNFGTAIISEGLGSGSSTSPAVT